MSIKANNGIGRPAEGLVQGVGQSNAEARVLIFSQRNIFGPALFRCPHYEFEDIITGIDSADVLMPGEGAQFPLRLRVAKRFAWHTPVFLNPGVSKVKREGRHYKLFVALCGTPVDLLAINTLPDWTKCADVSVCIIDELWVTQIRAYKHFLKILAKFDVVLLYYSESVDPVGRAIGRQCFYMPPGVDGLLFSPYPQCPERSIDVYGVGRRSAITHRQLVNLSREQKLFYVYDSVVGSRALDPSDHRALLANTARRSRYFLVNAALFDNVAVRGTQNEIGNRYFEGAAAGTIMIGGRPKNEQFSKLFDWQDVVLDLPADSTDVEGIIRNLDRRKDEHERIRRNNVIQTLYRHDWVYRWEYILQRAGVEPAPQLQERKERLHRLASDIACPTDRAGNSAPSIRT